METAGVYQALAQGLVYLKAGLSWIMSKNCIRLHVSWKPTRLEPIVLWPTWPSPTPMPWKRIAQHYFYFESFSISNQTKWWRLRYMKPLISPKSNQLRCYVSTQRFPKRPCGLDSNQRESAIRWSFFGKVGGRLPNKKGRRSGWSQVKPEFAKIKVEQKRVNVVLQDL